MSRDDFLGSQDLAHERFPCCGNQDPHPFKCSQCGLPFVYCIECSTVYPSLPDTTRFAHDHNALDRSRPSHRCQRCGYVFEFSFLRNSRYRVTRAEWLGAGLGALLRDADEGKMWELPPEISAIQWRLPWVPIGDRTAFTSRLAREAGPKHVLHGRRAVAIGRRLDQDDFLFYLPDGPAMLAEVRLTFSRRVPEPDPRIPWTVLYRSVRHWIENAPATEADGWPSSEPWDSIPENPVASFRQRIRRALDNAIMHLFLRPTVQINWRPRQEPPSRIDLEPINRELHEASVMQLRSYDSPRGKLVLVFSSEGGPRESQSYVVTFHEVILYHVPPVLHQRVFFRIATDQESRRLIPAIGYDANEVGGRVVALHDANGAALGYYVVAARASGMWEAK